MTAFFNARADTYDSHMLSGGGAEQYKLLGGCFPQTDEPLAILDIGCGSGIELDYIWERIPNAHVTCVDVSRGLLDLLLNNHPGKANQITVIEASYLTWPYPADSFDIVVSNQTMHHFWPDEKLGIYRNILSALKPGGCYMEGDFMVDAILAEQYRRRYESITEKLPEKVRAGEYHIDIPFTVETQEKLLKESGFGTVEVLVDNIKADWSYAVLRATKNSIGG